MIILYDEKLTITGVQTFPETSKAPHIKADDSLLSKVVPVCGYAKLVNKNGTLELPTNLEGLAEEKRNNELSEKARTERNSKLTQLDKIVSNPLRYNELTQETKDKLSVYRKELLDVPQQSGFPESIEWPQMPDLQ